MRQNVAYLAFNRGLVSRLALARQDIKRIGLSAETMVNWKPRVLGSMMLRPGLAYLGATQGNNTARYLPFIFATNDTALVELTDTTARIWINDILLTRVAVGSAVTNGTFAGNIAGWTDASDVGGAIAYAAANLLALTGNGTARAIARQTVAVAAADLNKEHALRVVIERGPVTFRVGAAAGSDSYVGETTLDTGVHSIAFTPTGDFFVQFSSTLKRVVRVSNCTIEAAGVVTIATPWTATDLVNVRIDQSADVVFVACAGFQQRRIERRGVHPGGRSWSVALYRSPDGPFLSQNVSATTMTASALSGNGTLTASTPTFKSTHVGALFELISSGQNVSSAINAANTFTNSIQVTNVGEQRRFTITITGVWVATVTLQRSLDNQLTWQDVASYTTNQAITLADGLDNQIVFYRIGIKLADYTSGTATCGLAYSLGSITGRARVTGFTSSTVVDVEVVQEFGSLSATNVWSEGAWSDYRGWPTSLAFYEGRLFWAGKNGIWGSVSDAFDSFDEDTTGDSGPINRTVGAGPVDTINWLLPLQRLLLGAQGAEISARSSTLDEPLTPTNFNLKTASTQGSAAVEAVKIDSRGAFVQRGGTRVFELAFDPQSYSLDYSSTQLTALIPEIGQPGITRMAVQRLIDTYVHCVRSDGVEASMLYDKVEQVNCWYTAQSDGATGTIEDICVLPAASGSVEDQVYYVVRRVINGAVVRYLEKSALESECIGGTVSKLADAHIVYSGVPVNNIAAGAASHLVGQQVVVWADGADVGTVDNADGSQTLTYTIAADGRLNADLPVAASNIVLGIGYTAQWKSAKLVQVQSQLGSSLDDQVIIKKLGLIMSNVHAKGIKYGPDFDHLDDLPGTERGETVAATSVRTNYDEEPFSFDGDWSPDARVCLQAKAPRPCVVLALVADARGE